jgi:hypothetical protein
MINRAIGAGLAVGGMALCVGVFSGAPAQSTTAAPIQTIGGNTNLGNTNGNTVLTATTTGNTFGNTFRNNTIGNTAGASNGNTRSTTGLLIVGVDGGSASPRFQTIGGNTNYLNTNGNTFVTATTTGNTVGNTFSGNTIGNTFGSTNGNTRGPSLGL